MPYHSLRLNKLENDQAGVAKRMTESQTVNDAKGWSQRCLEALGQELGSTWQ